MAVRLRQEWDFAIAGIGDIEAKALNSAEFLARDCRDASNTIRKSV